MKRMTVKPALREDYLEAAVCLHLRDTSHLPTVEGLASALGRPVTAVADDVRALASEGYLHIGENDTIALTPSGKELGMRVIKKHETLQCFLSEMLGMDSTSASNSTRLPSSASSSSPASQRLQCSTRSSGRGSQSLRRSIQLLLAFLSEHLLIYS